MTLGGRKVVLLAEDDPVQQEVLQEFLEYEGYRVVVAPGPDEVLLGLAEAPDVVLLDLVGVFSPEALRALHEAEPRPAVLLVSADPKLSEVAAALGVDGYLAKPYDLGELLARVEQALQRQQPAMAAAESCWANAP